MNLKSFLPQFWCIWINKSQIENKTNRVYSFMYWYHLNLFYFCYYWPSMIWIGVDVLHIDKNSCFLAKQRKDDWFAESKFFHKTKNATCKIFCTKWSIWENLDIQIYRSMSWNRYRFWISNWNQYIQISSHFVGNITRDEFVNTSIHKMNCIVFALMAVYAHYTNKTRVE